MSASLAVPAYGQSETLILRFIQAESLMSAAGASP